MTSIMTFVLSFKYNIIEQLIKKNLHEKVRTGKNCNFVDNDTSEIYLSSPFYFLHYLSLCYLW